MAPEVENGELDAHSWVALAIFLVAVVFVIRPVKIALKFGLTLHLNLATVPPLGILILLCSQTIDWATIRDGILGTNVGVKPYAIMLLFYSLAYICISLDLTGLIQFCAFWVSRRAGNRGITAFSLFFAMTSLISGLASNDVVILTGTAFLSYFTRVSDIHPTAFLMSEFTSANIASMALYIGNPTNVVVAEAYNMSFIAYSAWMLLPTFVCLAIAYAALRIVFRSQRYLPRVIHPPDAEPKTVLIDPAGAVFGLVLLAICMATLIGTSFVPGVSVWMVTLPFALVMLLRDICHDVSMMLQRPPLEKLFGLCVQPRPIAAQVVSRDDALTALSSVVTVQATAPLPPAVEEADKEGVSLQEEPSTSVQLPDASESPEDAHIRRRGGRPRQPDSEASGDGQQQENNNKHNVVKRWTHGRLPTTFAVLTRLPWKILPFAFSMFVLVEALSRVGFVGMFASGMTHLTRHYVATVFGVLAISLVACQVLNNLPMTILFTRVLQHPNFANDGGSSDIVKQAAVLGLIVGSNLGACLTLVGSLAGIMFDHILKTKGIYTLGYFQFLKWNLLLLPIIASGAAAVIIGELWFIYLR